MLKILSYLVAFLLANYSVIAIGTKRIEKAFSDADIVPQLIPKAPSALANVQYKSFHVHLGNVVTPLYVTKQPTVSWEAKSNKFYTLIMTDPDAPSPYNPILSQIQHWLIVNIPGNKVKDGEVLSTYLPPTPPPGGPHRYIFLIYEQDAKLVFDEPRIDGVTTTDRVLFSVQDFATKYGFGNPVAGNFFRGVFF